MAVAVLVLEPLAVQRRASRRAADQKAARTAVARGPCQVADPLEAEHRVVDVERKHRDAVVGVGGRGGDPGTERPRFVDPLLEDLPALGLAVGHQLVLVLRVVELPDLAEDPELAEHPFHPERARLVGNDRHDEPTERLVAQQRREDANKSHRRRDLALAGAFKLRAERRQLGDGQRRSVGVALRQAAAERGAALAHVDHLGSFVGRLVEADVVDLLIAEVQREAVTKREQRALVHLLLLVRDVAALARVAHPVALDRLGQDHGRLAAMRDRLGVGGVDLLGVVAAAIEAPDLGVGHALDHLRQLGVGAEEMLAHERAVA